MKARTLLLVYGLSLVGAAAADPIGAPRQGAEGWFFGPPEEGYNLQRRVPRTAQDTAIVPLPRPRPATALDALNPVTPGPPTAQTPEPSASVPSGPQNASTPQPTSVPLSAAEQGAAHDARSQTDTAETPKRAVVEPGKDKRGAAMPPVSISDAGSGRVRIEAHDAGLAQVLAALQDSHLIQFSASEPLSGTVTGTYTGTLPQVLSRILDGHNYFLRVTASGTELHALNASNDTNSALANRVSSNVEPAAAAAPAFSLSQTPVTPSPPAKARQRTHDD